MENSGRRTFSHATGLDSASEQFRATFWKGN